MKIYRVKVRFNDFDGATDRFFDSRETADRYAEIMEASSLVEYAYRFDTRDVLTNAENATDADLATVRIVKQHFHLGDKP